ncbi:tetratricopeptide repeat protein [Candidatus Thiodubiliella endoseptemdiera]|uniref:Sel1 repeat family protein n=1 Tax=Candidatus Thiodubiliella endoseptemdiera TaxID=2738886 RepID=A0A853F4J2_9GAMM|nr:sel1 repeat family protein [Candidatus Thiodubiliella endoseptemdiera]
MRLLFLLLFSLNVQALQLLQSKEGHNTVKQQLGRSMLPAKAKALLTQLKKEAKSGNARAQFSLANMYHHGINTNQDMKLALYWYVQVAKLGYPSAQFNVGDLYYNGVATERNLEKALSWYEKAAEQNLIKAQYKLAKIYHRQGNIEEARHWYEKSAKLGFSLAQLDLGELYEKKKNLKLAQYWYEKATMQFNAEAQSRLNKLINTKKSVMNMPSTQEITDSLAKNAEMLNAKINQTTQSNTEKNAR